MPVDIVLGGQGGDEGKGKIAEYLAHSGNYEIALRVPSPQAGHSVMMNGKRIGLANLPSAVTNPDIRLLIGIGGLVSLERLILGETTAQGIKHNAEIKTTGITKERLGIDYNTRVVTSDQRNREQNDEHLMKKIGSIGSGTSGCRVDTIMRYPDLKKAKDFLELAPYLTDTKKELFSALEQRKKILLESDHGAKLDMIHGEYPFVTTRIVNAAGFLSEAGISPKEVEDVYLVLKPYTTRVADGPLENEIFDKKVLNWTVNKGGEQGSISGRDRRIGSFEWENVSEVIKMNGATKLVITHMDAPNYVWKKIGFKDDKEFLDQIKNRLCKKYPYPKISLLSYGPELKDIMELK
ncbi:MAG: adenylosuccinate synthetase [Candidatus Pacearchaeota archaeon]|jgi:adenylosuccinate synthase